MSRTFILGRDHVFHMLPNDQRPPAQIASDGSIAQVDLNKYKAIDIVSDVTVSLGMDTADSATRASGLFSQSVSVEGNGTISTTMLWAPETAEANGLPAGIFDDILKMWINGCPQAFMITDGAIIAGDSNRADCFGSEQSNVYGLIGDFILTGLDWNQPLREPATADITLEFGLGLITPYLGIINPT